METVFMVKVKGLEFSKFETFLIGQPRRADRSSPMSCPKNMVGGNVESHRSKLRLQIKKRLTIIIE